MLRAKGNRNFQDKILEISGSGACHSAKNFESRNGEEMFPENPEIVEFPNHSTEKTERKSNGTEILGKENRK